MLTRDRVVPVPATVSTEGREPLLAIGSNACPAQLRRKGVRGPVFMVPTVLRNHLVVYAGHMTSYGAIPATVVRWPEARCAVFVTWLTREQLTVVDGSENGNYDLVHLPTSAGSIPGFRAISGELRGSQGMPIRLAPVMADGPLLPEAMSQLQAMDTHRRQSA